MGKLEWFLHQNDQQLGPFTNDQILQLHNTHMIAENAFVFKTGWEDWKLLSKAWDLLELETETPKAADDDNRPMRIRVSGRIIVHDSEKVVFGEVANISQTGVFIETKEQIFDVGDSVTLTVQLHEMSRSYHAKAQIIRYNANPKWPLGYGLFFEEVPAQLKVEIKDYIQMKTEEHQKKPAAAEA